MILEKMVSMENEFKTMRIKLIKTTNDLQQNTAADRDRDLADEIMRRKVDEKMEECSKQLSVVLSTHHEELMKVREFREQLKNLNEGWITRTDIL